MKIAVLSNVNLDPINRLLKKDQDIEIYDTQGYGNELGILLNAGSPLYDFKPDFIFIVIEIMELICHDLIFENAKDKIEEWFDLIDNSIRNDVVYYISDTYLFGIEIEALSDYNTKTEIEYKWLSELRNIADKHSNIRFFPYGQLIRKFGEVNSFSQKMWYMGKIPHTNSFHKTIYDEIKHRIDVEKRTSKKVLLLDLDNTLWRGLAGEHDINPIILSDDGIGLAYKNFQRVILQLKNQGVILGIISKNNEDDAVNIISNHPHMILRMQDFAVTRINWNNKAENILDAANELNIGLDSMVFLDDSEVERTLVNEVIPEVVVPKLPEKPEELAGFMVEMYHDYFEKATITAEDRNKTEQYLANKERNRIKDAVIDFDAYLKSLDIKIHRVDPDKNRVRLLQLMNKTNQFNLTTRRFSEQEISEIINDENKEVFLYNVSDRFGDNGIVAVVIVELGVEATITEFTMSCRVMGRKIEYAIIDDVEDFCRKRRGGNLVGLYKPTEKNKPVQNLYELFGYKKRSEYEDGTIDYIINLEKKYKRDYYIKDFSTEV